MPSSLAKPAKTSAKKKNPLKKKAKKESVLAEEFVENAEDVVIQVSESPSLPPPPKMVSEIGAKKARFDVDVVSSVGAVSYTHLTLPTKA